jgi:hypothetical protein
MLIICSRLIINKLFLLIWSFTVVNIVINLILYFLRVEVYIYTTYILFFQYLRNQLLQLIKIYWFVYTTFISNTFS